MNARSIFGLILIIIGGIFLLNVFGMWEAAEIISTWWPVVVMLFGIYIIINNRASVFTGIVVFAVGALLQASKLDMIPGGFWSAFWPLLLVLIGLAMIGNLFHKHNIKHQHHQKITDGIDIIAIFSGRDEKIISDNFKGGTINTIFGGAKIDMTHAKISGGNASLEIFAAFGGCELWIPDNWRLQPTGFPIFGAMEDKTRRRYVEHPDNPTLFIKYNVIFGGIEIKN
ncbi:MAG: hypothetical protein QG635_232 [Bacteroidota bacterium]|nr:hypothetical protein [Bacteroidota bacterium]